MRPNKMQPRESSKPESSSDEMSASEDESPDNQNQMNNKNIQALRNAREIALMAEERWLIEILKTTRQQRNALKVLSHLISLSALHMQGGWQCGPLTTLALSSFVLGPFSRPS